MSEPYPAASTQQPRRITRLARKPIKLASSAIRPLRSSSSTSGGVGGPSGAAAAGMGSGGTLNASGSSGNGSSSGGGSLEAPSSGSSSLNPLKRITSRSRNRESLAPGANANANAIESGAELDGTAIVKSVRGPRKPLDGEEPAAVVRVRVVKADGLVARDRNGSSDPYVSLLLAPSARQSTHHLKKTLSPVYPAKESTFDFPLYMSMASVIAGRGLEAVVWDKDMLGKDYMGELSLPMKEWFPGGTVVFMHDDAPMVTRKLVSSRRKQDVTGTLTLQIGFVPPKTLSQAQGQGQTEAELDRVKKVFQAIVEKGGHARSLAGVLGVPAHKGIGTIKLRNRRKSSKDLPLPGGSGGGAYTIGALTSESAAVIASMAAGKTMMPVSAQQDIDEGDDDDDAASLADDGLSSSSSDGEDDVDSTDDVEASAESPDATPFAGQTGAVPLPKHHQHDHGAKRRSTDQSASSVDSSTVPPLSHRQSGYFDRIRRESSPQDLAVPSTPGTGAGAGTGTASGATTPGGSKRPFFLRGRGSKASSASLIDGSGAGIDSPGKGKKLSKGGKGKRQSKKQKKKNFNFDAEHGKDILGIVVLEIQKAEDLPRIRSTLKLSYDSDPFVVISYGKKVFRTRVIRHSLNPVWDEKMLFHVRRNEQNFTVQFSVLDWDNMSGNDYLGACTLPLSELMADAPKPGPNGLYEEGVDGKHDSREFRLPIVTEEDVSWKSKHSPHLTFRAKYEPYDALRQKFWRQYIAQYDVDGNHSLSYTELSAMLDSLGSTLTHETIEGFFKTSGKTVEDELTMEEVILHLEREVNKPRKDRAKVSRGQSQSQSQAANDARSGNNSGTQTPDGIPSMAPQPAGSGLSMAGPQGNISAGPDPAELTEHILESTQKRDEHDKPGNLREAGAGAGVPGIHLREASADGSADRTPHNGLLHPSHAHSHALANATRGHRGAANSASHMGTVTPTFEDDASDVDSIASDDPSDTPDPDADADGDASSDDREPERVINIRTCPLCHRSRLKKKSEQDIITHLAICASADWSRVDRIVTANYVTSSQAQRKFLTRMVNKVAIGAYSLGANSANILVQDRITGQLQEEKMAVYVRLGIRVLYKGWKTQIAGGRAKRLLKSMSIKQGIKYDSPESKADILPFIAFHNLNLDEILDPLDSFKTFNEFFYRKLKPEARPVEKPGEEGRLVSCADCRMMAFETVDEATRIWIKGREFGVGRLLGDEYKDVWGRYDGGALAIFRLAPQDYHRFHSPVKGRVGKMTLIDGEYYTVNPQAIRTHLDVYGENVRKVVPIESEEFGTVMTVWVGAMMVGSIATTVEEGQIVERGEELGYFAFGGSTIVCLFEKGAVEWDEDLKENGQAAVETLVRMDAYFEALSEAARIKSDGVRSNPQDEA